MRTRSLLFGPAQRTDFVAKFVACGADIGCLDLEDATPVTAKADARSTLADARPGAADLGTMRLFVRVNALDFGQLEDDLAAAAAAHVSGVVVPKVESGSDIGSIRAAMAAAGLANVELCAGIESALGVVRAVEIAEAQVDLLYFGAEDYITDLGGVRTASNDEVLMARSQVALAARVGNVVALDQVVVDFADDERFVSEANMARSIGYGGKMCIHPSQVPLANSAFTPTEKELTWAKGVLAAAADAEAAGAGVFSYEGAMVDAPIIARATQILRR